MITALESRFRKKKFLFFKNENYDVKLQKMRRSNPLKEERVKKILIGENII